MAFNNSEDKQGDPVGLRLSHYVNKKTAPSDILCLKHSSLLLWPAGGAAQSLSKSCTDLWWLVVLNVRKKGGGAMRYIDKHVDMVCVHISLLVVTKPFDKLLLTQLQCVYFY